MDETQIDEEYFPLESQSYERPAESSPFDTLWTEFARSHPRLSPPRTPVHANARQIASSESLVSQIQPAIDLRALEYVSGYDSNLMCPICHVPFVDPVVLDCDHTFCADCFDEYRNGGPSTDRSRCPSCRAYYLGGSRKASRLIRNMCNEIQVRCPNEGCESLTVRGCIEQHATKECPEQKIPCPDPQCQNQTKRRNYVPEQCIHISHVECECGAVIPLGQGEWLKHRDQDCPILTGSAANTNQQEDTTHREVSCPGVAFGCTDDVDGHSYDTHLASCPLARLAPHLKKQSLLLKSLQEQLTMSKIHNEILETGFDRLNELINSHVQPKLDNLALMVNQDTASVSSVEEIPRDLSVLSAHLHELAPSPVFLHQQEPPLDTTVYPRLSAIESHLGNLDSQLTDLDARSSMALVNETLRIREELAHLNGAMYSTRAQVQWLLNRERIIGQREAMGANVGIRGRAGAGISTGNSVAQPAAVVADQAAGSSGQTDGRAETAANLNPPMGSQRPSTERNMTSAWSTSQAAAGIGSGPSSAATSPIFGAVRPSSRRSSSYERVKL